MPEILKPWESFESQLARLKSRGMQIADDQQALHYLETIGYYRLSGYWYPLRLKLDRRASAQLTSERASVFVSGSRFEDVVRLYGFDRKLRLLAMDALDRIEMAVRVDVAYLLGERDPLAHENPDYLHNGFTGQIIKKGAGKGKSRYNLWLDKYQKLRARAKSMPFVKHHEEKYGALPIWVAVEVWDFGLLSQLFSGMMPDDKDHIAKKYRVSDGITFAQWLHGLNFVRNTCAHHSRLWNLHVPKMAQPLNGRYRGLSNTQPFFYFCLMQYLLRTVSPGSGWHQRFRKLLEQEFPGEQFSLRDFGLLSGWEGWSLWR